MYSLHDITSVCPKMEPVSDEGEFHEEDSVSNHSDSQMDTMSEEFPVNNNNNNNNTIQIKVTEYKSIENGDTSFHEGTTTNSMGSHDNVSISQASDGLRDQAGVTNTSAVPTGVSVGVPEGQLVTVYTTAPVYQNGAPEALYFARNGGREIYSNNIESRILPQQNGVPEGLPDYQSSIYGIMPYVPTASKGGFSPHQGLSMYSGTHRSLTAHEMGIQLKPCCNCPCHLQESSQLPAFDMKNQRPSVIMVPSKNDAFFDSASKVIFN